MSGEDHLLPTSQLSRDRVKALLGRLALHLPPTRMPAQQFDLLLEDYLNDLAPYPITLIEAACNTWRVKGQPHFPKVSDLVRLIEDEQGRAATKVPERKPYQATGRWVAMTAEARAKIQDGMNRAAELQPGPMRDRLLSLGDAMLLSSRVWRGYNNA